MTPPVYNAPKTQPMSVSHAHVPVHNGERVNLRIRRHVHGRNLYSCQSHRKLTQELYPLWNHRNSNFLYSLGDTETPHKRQPERLTHEQYPLSGQATHTPGNTDTEQGLPEHQARRMSRFPRPPSRRQCVKLSQNLHGKEAMVMLRFPHAVSTPDLYMKNVPRPTAGRRGQASFPTRL